MQVRFRKSEGLDILIGLSVYETKPLTGDWGEWGDDFPVGRNEQMSVITPFSFNDQNDANEEWMALSAVIIVTLSNRKREHVFGSSAKSEWLRKSGITIIVR